MCRHWWYGGPLEKKKRAPHMSRSLPVAPGSVWTCGSSVSTHGDHLKRSSRPSRPSVSCLWMRATLLSASPSARALFFDHFPFFTFMAMTSLLWLVVFYFSFFLSVFLVFFFDLLAPPSAPEPPRFQGRSTSTHDHNGFLITIHTSFFFHVK